MKYFFTLFAAMLLLNAHAQNAKVYTRDSARISMSKQDVIELTGTTHHLNRQAVRLPFSGFIIKNVTTDSSYIGVKIKTEPLSSDKTYEKVVLKQGTSPAVMSYLNNRRDFVFTPAVAGFTCFIKQLRITEIDSLNKSTGNKEKHRRLSFEAEAFLDKENMYYPALRLDTIAVSVTVDKNDYSLLADVLDVFAAKAALIDTGKIFKRNSYQLGDLEKRYVQRFNKPVLQAQQLTAGVYKTFNEFINNNPSVKQYEFKKDRKTTILYTREEGNDWLPETKAFGFCDGRILWLNVDNVFYPLVRQGNTFEFLADYYTINDRTLRRNGPYVYGSSSPVVALAGSLIGTALQNAFEDDPSGKIVYQLNMENGTFY